VLVTSQSDLDFTFWLLHSVHLAACQVKFKAGGRCTIDWKWNSSVWKQLNLASLLIQAASQLVCCFAVWAKDTRNVGQYSRCIPQLSVGDHGTSEQDSMQPAGILVLLCALASLLPTPSFSPQCRSHPLVCINEL